MIAITSFPTAGLVLEVRKLPSMPANLSEPGILRGGMGKEKDEEKKEKNMWGRRTNDDEAVIKESRTSLPPARVLVF